MDIFLIPVLRTLILLLGASHMTIYQTKKSDRLKNTVGGSYLLVYKDEVIHFNFADLENGSLKEKCRGRIIKVASLGEFDYKQLVEKFRKEFGEK